VHKIVKKISKLYSYFGWAFSVKRKTWW